jgi:hypothetical protein
MVSSIGKGVCVLVGIGVDDKESDIDYMVRKILSFVFDEGGVMWKKSVQDMDYELLCGKDAWFFFFGFKRRRITALPQMMRVPY